MDDAEPPHSPALLCGETPNLLCRETLTSSDDENAVIPETETLCSRFHNQCHSIYENEDEYIKFLAGKETERNPSSSVKEIDFWLMGARKEAIPWIMEKQVSFGFRCQTAYLAVLYLGRFLSRLTVFHYKESWMIELMSVCLLIAAKFEEGTALALSQFLSPIFNHDLKCIKKMEQLVFIGLRWKMVLITPFCYLPCFISKFSNELRGEDSHLMSILDKAEHSSEVVSFANHFVLSILFTLVYGVTVRDATKDVFSSAVKRVQKLQSRNRNFKIEF